MHTIFYQLQTTATPAALYADGLQQLKSLAACTDNSTITGSCANLLKDDCPSCSLLQQAVALHARQAAGPVAAAADSIC